MSSIKIKRLCLWIIIILYTAFLPEFVYLYEWIVQRFSEAFTAKLPLMVVIVFYAIFSLFFIAQGRAVRGLVCLLFCIFISVLIFRIVDIPNKRIHIPEYVLMSWLLFGALRSDYSGKGGALLILVLSSLLGIVDEVIQGFHPKRYYGYADMVVNSLSSIIGIMLLNTSEKRFPTIGNIGIEWGKNRPAILMNAMGIVGASCSCYYLRAAATNNTFFLSFPVWVIMLDIILCIGIAISILFSLSLPVFKRWYAPSSQPAAILWLFLPKAVFLVIMSLTIVGYFLGLEFK